MNIHLPWPVDIQEGCQLCKFGIKHKHVVGEGLPSPAVSPISDPEMKRLLQRWLEWALDWGDRDMYQALVAETKKVLGEGGPKHE